MGKELKFDGIDEIKYELTPGAVRGIVSDFKLIFPDLAGKPLKVGETWSTFNTLLVSEDGSDLELLFEGTNKLEGYEDVEGYKCAKIITGVKGKLGRSGKQGPFEYTLEGDITGTDIWYFAFEKGMFVKVKSEAQTVGNIIGSNMKIPMKMKIEIENGLIK